MGSWPTPKSAQLSAISVHSMVLDVNGLYSKDPQGPFYYCGGYNPAALAALVLSVVSSVPGFLHKVGILVDTFEAFIVIYDNDPQIINMHGIKMSEGQI
ncbi:purine-uracil permease NCS1-like isoform X2 [Asparagus officinalis]|uniref:purine-uracil permease NCS1-like isoform X2 n=1 Tax=Asparagus officinalis TaxID=4686 RepID=UPI00098E527C|nr:purine-uracil permease NCS1-like isoform X2 [Asparagus officinalis]